MHEGLCCVSRRKNKTCIDVSCSNNYAAFPDQINNNKRNKLMKTPLYPRPQKNNVKETKKEEQQRSRDKSSEGSSDSMLLSPRV